MVRVLVIKPSSLGDIIHSAEGVERLSRATPDCRVSWIVNEGFEDFVREFPGVEETIPFPRGRYRLRRFPLWLPGWFRWVRGLRRGFDVAIDLQGLQRSGLLARLSGAKERFGPAEAREFATMHYRSRIAVDDAVVHAIDRVNALIDEACRRSSILGDPVHPDARGFRLPVPESARELAASIVSQDERAIVALCPGARWKTKLWPAERWAALLELLSKSHPELRPLFLGAPGEESFVDAIRQLTELEVESLVGSIPIWTSAALMERSRAVVTMDSAPLHLAVAVGAPTVSFFGPTDVNKVGPRGDGHRVLRRELDCIACYRRECPLERRICVPETTAEEALAAIESVLRPEPDRGAIG